MATLDSTRCRTIPHCHGCCDWYQCIWSYTRKTRRSSRTHHAVPSRCRNILHSQRTIRRIWQWRNSNTNNRIFVRGFSIWRTCNRRLRLHQRLWCINTSNRLWWQFKHWNGSEWLWRKRLWKRTCNSPGSQWCHQHRIWISKPSTPNSPNNTTSNCTQLGQ